MRLFKKKKTGPVVYRGAEANLVPGFKGTKEDCDRIIDVMLGKTRPTESQTLMEAALLWSKRGTCSRLQVGAVIARDGRTVSSGYNGNPASLKHCEHLDDSPCKTAAHAEENAIVYAARAGVSTSGCTIYCTHAPCTMCARMIINSGIKKVVYQLDYRDSSGIDLLRQANVDVRKYNAKPE